MIIFPNGLLLFIIFFVHSQSSIDACSSREVPTLIDISTSKIIKTSIYEYSIKNFDNEAQLGVNQNGELLMRGNFSRITLRNKALNKEYLYNGNQIILRIPSTHFYSTNRSAQAQLQIIYELTGAHKQNRHRVITMTQLYLTTQFLSKIEIKVCKEVNKLKNGSILHIKKLLKIIQNTPVLTYQGSKDFYPCRHDLLCMVRKEFALISQEDLDCLKQNMQIQTVKQGTRTFMQKNLIEVEVIKQTGQANSSGDL